MAGSEQEKRESCLPNIASDENIAIGADSGWTQEEFEEVLEPLGRNRRKNQPEQILPDLVPVEPVRCVCGYEFTTVSGRLGGNRFECHLDLQTGKRCWKWQE